MRGLRLGLSLTGVPSPPPELVTNGDFSVGTGWTLPGGATISGGVLTSDGTPGYVYQSGPGFIAGATYRFTLTISGYVSGDVKAYGNASPTFTGIFTGNGVKTQDIVIPGTNSEQGMLLNALVGSIDDFSIRRVL